VLVLSQYVKESYAIKLLKQSATGVGYLLPRLWHAHVNHNATRHVRPGAARDRPTAHKREAPNARSLVGPARDHESAPRRRRPEKSRESLS
jgi:hypothetical protein